jgi:hypothetical protein
MNRRRDPSRPFRIGAGAGYAGDRIDPARDLAEHGQLDALVFECLAERTIALAQQRRQADPEAGFDPLLGDRLRAVLPACVREGTTVLTNMGAAHPMAAGRLALAVARELGLPRLRVAVVTGDDVLPWLRAHPQPLLEVTPSAATSDGLGDDLVAANAYLGADALWPALDAGADLVIGGRIADPALFLAPLIHHFGWSPDDWLRLGRGTAVGHLLECAAQVSGGYIGEPGRFDVPDLESIGFPLAEVDPDGEAVIGKLPGSGGRIDRVTVAAQLLYEIEDPSRYLQPDVTADFAGVQLHEAGPDRVRVTGARGHPRPERLKATIGWRDGYIGEAQIGYAGPGARSRGEWALRVLEHRMGVIGLGALEHRAELIGVNALHGPAAASDPSAAAGTEPSEVRLRWAARCATRGQAERVAQEVEALYLNGPAAGGGVTQSVREVLAVASCLVPRAAVRPAITMMEWAA